MRVRNRRKNPRCACEHIDHAMKWYGEVDGRVIEHRIPRIKHRYGQGTADGGWALYVGHVCRDCAETCMKDWIVGEHVCGEGDCRR